MEYTRRLDDRLSNHISPGLWSQTRIIELTNAHGHCVLSINKENGFIIIDITGTDSIKMSSEITELLGFSAVFADVWFSSGYYDGSIPVNFSPYKTLHVKINTTNNVHNCSPSWTLASNGVESNVFGEVKIVDIVNLQFKRLLSAMTDKFKESIVDEKRDFHKLQQHANKRPI